MADFNLEGKHGSVLRTLYFGEPITPTERIYYTYSTCDRHAYVNFVIFTEKNYLCTLWIGRKLWSCL
jgi:hypothetical protein